MLKTHHYAQTKLKQPHCIWNIVCLCETCSMLHHQGVMSQAACGVMIWCGCLLSCSLAEPDNNWASVLFPAVKACCHPLPPHRPHSHTRASYLEQCNILIGCRWHHGYLAKKYALVGRYDFTVCNSRDREGATRHTRPQRESERKRENGRGVERKSVCVCVWERLCIAQDG